MGYGLIIYCVLIAVAVKMNSDSLFPMGVQRNAFSGIICRELVLGGYLGSTFGSIKPAGEDITCALRVLYRSNLAAGVGHYIVVVFADNACAVCFFSALIVGVNGHGNGQTLPRSVELCAAAVLIRKVFDRFTCTRAGG